MDLAYELHDLVRTLDKWAERKLRPEGLTYNSYVALVIVMEHPGMTGRDLARALGISEPSTSAMVRRLVEATLLEDTAPPASGNAKRLAITHAGVEKTRHCSELLGDSLDRNAVAIGIDPLELATTIRNLHDEVRAVRSAHPDVVSPSTAPTSSSSERTRP